MRFSKHWRFWPRLWCCHWFRFHVMVRGLLFWRNRRYFLLSHWWHHWFIICKCPIPYWRFWINRCSTWSRFVSRLLWRNGSCHKVRCSWLLQRLSSLWCSCIRLFIFLEIKICSLPSVPLRCSIVTAGIPLKRWFSPYQVYIRSLIRLRSLRLFFIQLRLVPLDLFSFQRQLLPFHFDLMFLINNLLDGLVVILGNFAVIGHYFLI